MSQIDLSAMSLDELKTLQKDVSKAIETYEQRQRQDALAAAEAAAKQHGYSLSSLTGGAARKSRTVNPPKYRHPENPSLTWSGKGRQPKWIKEAVEAGRPLDDFLITP